MSAPPTTPPLRGATSVVEVRSRLLAVLLALGALGNLLGGILTIAGWGSGSGGTTPGLRLAVSAVGAASFGFFALFQWSVRWRFSDSAIRCSSIIGSWSVPLDAVTTVRWHRFLGAVLLRIIGDPRQAQFRPGFVLFGLLWPSAVFRLRRRTLLDVRGLLDGVRNEGWERVARGIGTPPGACPACGHAIGERSQERCPECGAVTPAWAGAGAAAAAGE